MSEALDDPRTELERRVGPLRLVCVLETVTYLALAGFWIAGNRTGRLLLSGLHGNVFLVFAFMVLAVHRQMRWSWRWVAVVLLTGPIGPLLVFDRLRRHGVPPEHRSTGPGRYDPSGSSRSAAEFMQ